MSISHTPQLEGAPVPKLTIRDQVSGDLPPPLTIVRATSPVDTLPGVGGRRHRDRRARHALGSTSLQTGTVNSEGRETRTTLVRVKQAPPL